MERQIGGPGAGSGSRNGMSWLGVRLDTSKGLSMRNVPDERITVNLVKK
jgi:hypothetical protein